MPVSHPQIVPDGYLAVAMEITPPGSGGQQLVTFGVQVEDGDPAAATFQLVAILNGFWTDQACSDYSFDNLKITVGSAGPPYVTAETAGGGAGGRSGDCLPPAACVVVNKRSNQAGRSGRGRFFWPGLVKLSEQEVDGTIESGRYSDLQTAFTGLRQDIEDADNMTNMVLLHTDLSPFGDPGQVTFLTPRPLITWLRSREY
jgi:hypothetical protein